MDLEVLKKKVSSYRTEGGSVRKVSDELLMEILLSWEQWTGPTSGFCAAVGISRKGISSIIGKAKKLRREGFPTDGFKELKVIEGGGGSLSAGGPCSGIELVWNEKVIRFPEVDPLIDFLKKVA